LNTGRTGSRRRARGWARLALVLAILPLSTNVDALTFLQIFSTDHPHALMTVVDGGHVDLILSHDATRPVGDDDEPSLHPKTAEDHVVHIAKDELAAAQKRIAEALPAATSPPTASVAALPLSLRSPSVGPVRAVASFSRRSVVLRT
jgi:hypothetical protein